MNKFVLPGALLFIPVRLVLNQSSVLSNPSKLFRVLLRLLPFHLNCVMDCIEVCSFCTFCKVEFTCCCAVFCFYSHFKVLLCAVCYNFAKKFCEFSSVFCFFVSSFFPVKSDFRIAFSVSYSCHCKIHSYLNIHLQSLL